MSKNKKIAWREDHLKNGRWSASAAESIDVCPGKCIPVILFESDTHWLRIVRHSGAVDDTVTAIKVAEYDTKMCAASARENGHLEAFDLIQELVKIGYVTIENDKGWKISLDKMADIGSFMMN